MLEPAGYDGRGRSQTSRDDPSRHEPPRPGFKPDERALVAWGEKFLDLHRYGKATDIDRLAATLYPDSGRALFHPAMTHDRRHDNAAALDAYRRVLVVWPDQV